MKEITLNEQEIKDVVVATLREKIAVRYTYEVVDNIVKEFEELARYIENSGSERQTLINFKKEVRKLLLSSLTSLRNATIEECVEALGDRKPNDAEDDALIRALKSGWNTCREQALQSFTSLKSKEEK
mgnify:CR=1 FL=1